MPVAKALDSLFTGVMVLVEHEVDIQGCQNHSLAAQHCGCEVLASHAVELKILLDESTWT